MFLFLKKDNNSMIIITTITEDIDDIAKSKNGIHTLFEYPLDKSDDTNWKMAHSIVAIIDEKLKI